ncbi:MAG: tetraacyldisaccharide 4'-kinase, partial [Bryobacteraceae bacterium]
VAGRALAAEKLGGLAAGIFYVPIDYRFAVRKVLRALRPSLVVVLETEIWPTLYRETKRAGCGLMIVNGRISDRAIPRYRRLRWFFERVLSLPDAILVQSERDRDRYLELGAPPERVRIAGNLKYDFTPGAVVIPEAVAQLLARIHPARIWIAASTMPPADSNDVDEDDIVLQTFIALSQRYPDLLLMLAPRRPERFDAAASRLTEARLRFLRRSALTGAGSLELPGVLLLDSIGELSALFSIADVVFMGGTLARRGGHNVLEPAFFAKPVIVGPHMENFAAIAREFIAGGAVSPIPDGEELAGAVSALLDRPDLAHELGARARKLAEAKRGAADRVASEIVARREQRVASPVPPLAARALLGPLGRVWQVGATVDRRRNWARRRALDTPVVSVGGVTMGGAGKTPLVAHLALRLQAAGLQPAILTRGYRRRAPGADVIVPAGGALHVDLTGDEAQILVRAGNAHVGIGAHRFAIGRAIERQFHPAVFLLDDGFQHHRLDRMLDIVSIDALNPFGGRELFPLGQLREPLTALDRADIFVIARAEPGLPLKGIEKVLRQFNSRAPIFRSHIVFDHWTDLEWGVTCGVSELPYRKVAAFCGLANPSSFWRSLESLNVEVTFLWRFPDHHHYTTGELRRLAARARASGAEALVTTEKDLMNLSDNVIRLIAPMHLYWLKIGLRIEHEEDFLRYVLAKRYAQTPQSVHDV